MMPVEATGIIGALGGIAEIARQTFTGEAPAAAAAAAASGRGRRRDGARIDRSAPRGG